MSEDLRKTKKRIVYQNHLLSISYWLEDLFIDFLPHTHGILVKTENGNEEATLGDVIVKEDNNFAKVIKKTYE